MDECKGPLHHSALHPALTDNQRAKLLQTQVPGVLVCRGGGGGGGGEGERGGGGKGGGRVKGGRYMYGLCSFLIIDEIGEEQGSGEKVWYQRTCEWCLYVRWTGGGGGGGGGDQQEQEKLTRYIQVRKIDMKMGCLSLLEPSEYCLMDIE